MRRTQLEYPVNMKRILSDQFAISLRIETEVQHGITYISIHTYLLYGQVCVISLVKIQIELLVL